MDLQLAGKTALVTGGSRGIGKAIALVLAAEGVDVAIAARDPVGLASAAKEVADQTGRRVLHEVVDTGLTASVDAMVDRVKDQFGHIDVLVNSAARPGGAPPKSGIEYLPDEAFTEQMNIKVLGYLRCARAVTPLMKGRGWGRIINISGLAARNTGNPIGSMRNVAVAALSKNLADELGPFGINVTCVHPGLTWTEGVAEMLLSQAAARGESVAKARERFADLAAVRRIIAPVDVANVVAFLASPLSIAITGDSIATGGGYGSAIYY